MDRSRMDNLQEEQGQRQQQGRPQAFQAIIRGSVNAYASTLRSALSLYRQGFATAGQVALSPLRVAVWTAQQGARSSSRIAPTSRAAGAVASQDGVQEAAPRQGAEAIEQASQSEAEVSRRGVEVDRREDAEVASAVARSGVREETNPRSSRAARAGVEAADRVVQEEDAEIAGGGAQRAAEDVDETARSDATTDRAGEGVDPPARVSPDLATPPTPEESPVAEGPPPAALEEPVIAEEPPPAAQEEAEPLADRSTSILEELPPPPRWRR